MKSTVENIMTTQVVAVHRCTPFKEMAARLRQERVSAFPVVDDDGTVVGVVSETDLLPKETLDAGWAAGRPEMTSRVLNQGDQEKAESVTAADLMTEPAVTAAPGDTVEHAARQMYTHRVKRLPVTDASGRLVGIISRADVLTVFDRPDGEIRGEITENLILNELHADPGHFTVTVENGIVTLEGTPETAALGRVVAARARHVQGVVAAATVLVTRRPSVPHLGRCPDRQRGPRLITGSAGGLPVRAGGPGQSQEAGQDDGVHQPSPPSLRVRTTLSAALASGLANTS